MEATQPQPATAVTPSVSSASSSASSSSNSSTGPAPASRGRPRGFCCEKALDAALQVFWAKGYEGTSLDDLTAAMGINRPSLYAAFGNKEELFKKVLKRYGERSACMVQAAMSDKSAHDFVQSVLHKVAELLADPTHPCGCLSLQGGMAMGDESTAVKDALLEQRKQTECIFAKRFTRAIEEKELPKSTDAAALAKFYSVIIHGMAVQATVGASKQDLLTVVDTGMKAWPGK